MAIAAWKRIELSPSYQRKKLFLKRLIGKEPRLKPDIQLSTVHAGGWCYTPAILGRDSIVYSLGVGKDIDFDEVLIRQFGLQVHAFDPTPSTVEWIAAQHLPANLYYYPWAVTARDGMLRLYPRINRDGSKSSIMYSMVAADPSRDDGIEVPAFSLATVTAKLGHNHIDLLKIDIEGAEYEVLSGMLDSTIRPHQLLVEFHHRLPGIGPSRTKELVARLRDAGYQLFSISNTGREFSFLLI